MTLLNLGLDEELEPRKPSEGWTAYNDMAWAVPHLVDVFFPHGDVFRWFTLEFAGDGLEVEEAAVDEIGGPMHEHLEFEVENTGWVDMMNLPWQSKVLPSWALQEGIAPGQPFLFRFGKPHVFSCGSYYEPEYDVEYDTEIVRVEPWSDTQAVQAWDKFFEQRDEYLDYMDECKERLARDKLVRVDHMYLTGPNTFTTTGYYDTWPRGVRYNLCSNYKVQPNVYDHVRGFHPPNTRAGILVSGEDEKGDSKKAMANLIEKAIEMMPHLTEEQIRALPKRQGMW
jgi:hypothetical protein